MKLAFLFPGQGMQEPGMHEALAPDGPEWACLARAVGLDDLPRVLARGGAQLERTDVLQPVLTAVALATAARLESAGIRPDVVAGHSVGELAAWSVAGGIAPADAIRAAAVRGRLMAREAARRPGGMLALLDTAGDSLEAVLARGAARGVVALAAVNAPDQRVLAGELAALDAVAARYPASRRLAVAGAWHCELMAGALAALRAQLGALDARPPATPFVVNRTGQTVDGSDDLAAVLAEQLVRPVQWAACLATLERLGVTDVVTVGPGRTLRGLVRKNLGGRVRVHATDGGAELERTIARLKGRTHEHEGPLQDRAE